jgi:hypothetical protein
VRVRGRMRVRERSSTETVSERRLFGGGGPGSGAGDSPTFDAGLQHSMMPPGHPLSPLNPEKDGFIPAEPRPCMCDGGRYECACAGECGYANGARPRAALDDAARTPAFAAQPAPAACFIRTRAQAVSRRRSSTTA